MNNIKNYKQNLYRDFNKAIETINSNLPNFEKGKIEKEEEEDYISLSYSSGEENYEQKQKYLHIKIDAVFYDKTVEIFYTLSIADESKPFSWRAWDKFESEYIGCPIFDRWMLIQLREREEEMKDKFNYLFDNHIKITGNNGITESSKELLKAIIEGVIKLKKHSKIF